MRGLYEKGYNGDQVRDLYRFIDWIMVLPEKLSDTLWSELKAFEQEKNMTFITSGEKIGFKRAQKEMALKLLQRGMSLEEVASITELSIKEVNVVQSRQK